MILDKLCENFLFCRLAILSSSFPIIIGEIIKKNTKSEVGHKETDEQKDYRKNKISCIGYNYHASKLLRGIKINGGNKNSEES